MTEDTEGVRQGPPSGDFRVGALAPTTGGGFSHACSSKSISLSLGKVPNA